MNKNKDLLNAIEKYIEYWAKQSDKTELERLRGLAFSILRILDGVSSNFKGDLNTLAELKSPRLLHHAYLETLQTKSKNHSNKMVSISQVPSE